MKYELRPYKCLTCGSESEQGTNHIGEIYVQCKVCKNTGMECTLPEAEEARAAQADGKALMVGYRYSMENPEEKEAYIKMSSELIQRGFKKFDHHEHSSAAHAKNNHAGEVITLYNKTQFKEQYVSNIGRVHSWEEYIFPNKRIKMGYYLEMR